jgi:molybdate transport system substrate-binding protein
MAPAFLLAWACGLAAAVGEVPADPMTTAQAPEVMVYAAASLRNALQDMAPQCEQALGVRLAFNFGASSDLARQIEAGNKADVFFSADEGFMDKIARAGLVDAISRRSPLSNRLVVVVPADSDLRIRTAADLAAPGLRHLSLANPEAVPAGRYARAWLESAGVWDRVCDRVVPGVDVRAALAAVESGAVEAGIVYGTDAATSRRVRVALVVQEGEGPRISYALAALRTRPRLAEARRVVEWLAGPLAAPVFERCGFIRLPGLEDANR